MIQRKRTREWTIIIAAAILLHAVLFLSIRPEFFSAFRKTVEDAERGPSRPFGADVIVTIPIEIEDQLDQANEQNPVQESPQGATERAKQSMNRPAARRGRPDAETLEIENLTGRSPETLRRDLGPPGLAIPPRPVEITWPDTRSLRHCLGHSIDVRVEVGERGEVLNVQALEGDHPADCVGAAVASARKIVFEPGEIDGVRTRMWTQIRIDFRRKN